MYTARVLTRLLEIQRRAGQGDGSVVSALALDAQDDLLEIERNLVEAFSEIHELKRRLETCERSRAAAVPRALEMVR